MQYFNDLVAAMKTTSVFLFTTALLLSLTGCVNKSKFEASKANQPANDAQGTLQLEHQLAPDLDTLRPPPVLTSADELDVHVGQLVTIRGKVSNFKIPTIIGVDVQSNDPDLRGHVAEATGLLQRNIVTPEDVEGFNDIGIAHRGAGIFYRLKDRDSDYEAAVRVVSP